LYDDTLTTTGEFLEILNAGSQTVDLQGYTIANAVDFTFPSGVNIAPGERVVVARNSGNLNIPSVQVFEWDGGKLTDQGEAIHLFDASGLLVDFVRYNNHSPWPERSTLLGKSLELVSQNLDNHFSSSWKASNAGNGTPGAPSSSVGTFIPLAQRQFTVFPNPTADQLTMVLKQAAGESALVTITDLNGKTVLKQLFLGEKTWLTLPKLPSGAYFVSVFDTLGKLLGIEKVVVK
jgi:hypothetical protein